MHFATLSVHHHGWMSVADVSRRRIVKRTAIDATLPFHNARRSFVSFKLWAHPVLPSSIQAPGLKLVVNALLASIPKIGDVVVICVLIFLIFAIIGATCGTSAPDTS